MRVCRCIVHFHIVLAIERCPFIHKDIDFTLWEVSFTSALCSYNSASLFSFGGRRATLSFFTQQIGRSSWTLPPPSSHAAATSLIFLPPPFLLRPLKRSPTSLSPPHGLPSSGRKLQYLSNSAAYLPPLQRTRHSVTFTSYRHDNASTPTSSSSPTKLWTILHPYTWLISSNTTPPPANIVTPIIIIIIATTANNHSNNSPSGLEILGLHGVAFKHHWHSIDCSGWCVSVQSL